MYRVTVYAFELKMHKYFRADDAVGHGHFSLGLPGIQMLAREIFVQHEASLHVLPSTPQICLLNLNWYYRRMEQTGDGPKDGKHFVAIIALGDSCSAKQARLKLFLARCCIHYTYRAVLGSQTVSHSCPSLTGYPATVESRYNGSSI